MNFMQAKIALHPPKIELKREAIINTIKPATIL